VVVAADGHAVVPQRQDLVFRADDAGAHLAVVVLGAHGGKQGDAHKIFIPTDIIRSFHSVPLPSYSFYLYYTVRNAHSQGCLCKYLRRVASPPRRWRSALLRCTTVCTSAHNPGWVRRSRLWSFQIVLLLTPNTTAAARTVAPVRTMYRPTATARSSGSPFIPPTPSHGISAKSYVSGAGDMPGGKKIPALPGGGGKFR